jgi:peptidoglycan L-alanyl-D-glutamate endopeptidase CwlK
MPEFGERSKRELATAHPDLQRLFTEVIKDFDVTILEGRRTTERQQALYAQGRTAKGRIVTYADGVTHLSNHQRTDTAGRGLAVDVAPWPIDWDDESRFYRLAGFVQATALHLGIHVEWGGDWPGKKRDLPHWQVRP